MTSSPTPTDARRLRLYFALWPERALAEALLTHGGALQAAIGGKVTRAESIHLTLAFLGDVTASKLGELLDPPASIAVPVFTLELDRLGAWHHNGIGWIAPDAAPPDLMLLQKRLGTWLGSIGIEFERRPFSPHVTLVRKGGSRFETTAIESVRWPVADYVLVRSSLSTEGSRYDVMGRFKLPAGT